MYTLMHFDTYVTCCIETLYYTNRSQMLLMVSVYLVVKNTLIFMEPEASFSYLQEPNTLPYYEPD
jgi:hypothetical protein